MGTDSSAVETFQAIVGPEAVLHDADELRVYESDGFPIARGLPTLVIFPTTTQQIARCVQAAVALDLPLVPRGSGT
ncbi:MAG: hypothetical protein WD118_05870, partial [Phycisphaeraceae bacterium]